MFFLAGSAVFCLEEGYASWYGGKFHGRSTASGEIFNTDDFTAAHRTLPFGTRVKVTNLENGKSTIVRINDRGPFIRGRIIDLSRAAAETIDMMHAGVVKVRIEVVETPEKEKPEAGKIVMEKSISAPDAEAGLIIQVGAYAVRENAVNVNNILKAEGFSPQLEDAESGITKVIIVGVLPKEINEVKSRLRKIGISAVLVRRR